MDLLLILTYTAICVAIFKIFRIPLNKWTVPTAALGGVLQGLGQGGGVHGVDSSLCACALSLKVESI